jgi:hypothetical protein
VVKAPKSVTKPGRSAERKAFAPRTALGKELWAIRLAALAAGMKTATWEQISRELAESRGGPEGRE